MRALVLSVALLVGACGARSGLDAGNGDGSPRPETEECNAMDDDGDGRVDEGIAPQSCGVGACRREVTGCEGGTVPECRPGAPSMEACNGIDDDCDGSVDEGLGLGPVGEPTIVRPEDAFGSDRCSTCRVAFSPDVVSTDAGLLVTWRLGFLGTEPEPNTFARSMSSSLEPLEDIELLTERNTTQGVRSKPHPSGAVLVYCGRYDANDVTASMRVTPRGRPLGETRRSPRDRSCGAWTPDVLWTGQRTLFAWTDNSSGPIEGHEVLLDVAGEDGDSRDWRMLEPEGAGAPRMAMGHERVILVVAVTTPSHESRMVVHRFDRQGNVAGEPQRFELPDASDDAFRTPHVLATSGGFIIHAASAVDGGGRFVVKLAPDGSVVSGPERVDEGVEYVNGFDDLIARGSGAVVSSSMRYSGGEDFVYAIRTLGADGSLEAEWRPDDMAEPGFARAAFTTHRGRLYVTYTVGVDDERNQVRIRELGCR